MATDTTTAIPYGELHRTWAATAVTDRLALFQSLPLADAQEFFRELSTRQQCEIISELPQREQTVWMRLLAPDDAADLLQEIPLASREPLLELLDEVTTDDVRALLKYREDVAGGLMSPRFARVRPDMTVSESLTYVRKQALGAAETVYTVYVLDAEQHLLGVTSLRTLFAAEPHQLIQSVMRTNVVTTSENVDQEQLSRLFAEHDLIAIPVVDAERRMKGIVTIDDIVDVVQEEATEDMQKMGGSEALGAPYFEISFAKMIKKRAGWLTVLFLGEMLTANAMGHYESEIAKAVILSLFIPLIISSGGNAGSQASTIVIRAMALGEVRLIDWFRVMRLELLIGLSLGCILGAIGFVRIAAWQYLFHSYGQHSWLLGITVGLSLIGIVLWGTIAGALLPFVLRRVGFDPASASTPFVATLVDVTGLVIYFSVASWILRGTLL
ncbi:MAG: magnesium transporter [Candidatus Melainabacteria bacterium]|nr:magnesium transporter [Candidatus Melainabacteria bacterium]